MDSEATNDYHRAGRVGHKPTPTRDFLRERYDYDPACGALVLKTTGRPSRTWTGSAKDPKRWRWITQITKFIHSNFIHSRLVWAWHHGDPGSFQVDHIDGNKRNDRIENLRLATPSQNNAAKKHFKGYSLRKGKWIVDVMKDGKHFYGGTYAKEEDAAKAAVALRRVLHGEFAQATYRKPTETAIAKNASQMTLFDGASL